MLRTLALLALVASVAATGRSDYQKTRKRCKNNLERKDGSSCSSLSDFNQRICDQLPGDGCYIAKKVSEQYKNGECCDEFECVLQQGNPCCGVSCEAEDIGDADDTCNIIHPNNEVWDLMSPYKGAMYSELVERRDEPRGKCCDKFKCRTDFTQLCLNELKTKPCTTAASCPACHYAEVSQPADPVAGECCPKIVCIEDPECMCSEREEDKIQNCPMPECDSDYEYLIILAEATSKSCCPVYTCQRDLEAVCQEKRENYQYTTWFGIEAIGFTDSTPEDICGPCATVTKYRAPNPTGGRCFPTWKCAPSTDKCCESDFFFAFLDNEELPFNQQVPVENLTPEPGKYPNRAEFDDDSIVTCQDITDEKASCDATQCEVQSLLRERNPAKGRCCDTYTCSIQSSCVCATQVCPFENAEAYQAFSCPNKPGVNTKKFWRVDTIPALPTAGKCCDTYVCRATADKKIRDMRVSKRKAKRKASKARNQSTRK